MTDLKLTTADGVTIASRLSHSRDVPARVSDQLVVSAPIKPSLEADATISIATKTSS